MNGTPAIAGQRVTPGVDRVTVDGRAVEPVSALTYLMMNKPVGVLTSVGDDRGRQTVVDRLPPEGARVFPVGRLDLDSRGLILLTDDGELAGRLAALTHAVATGRVPDDFSAALAGGKDWGYVVALPRVTADVCRSAKDLLPSWPATFTALVDTRPTAIVRRGVARWTVDQDGTVHLAP